MNFTNLEKWADTWSNSMLECALEFTVQTEDYETAQEIQNFLNNRKVDIQIPKGQMMPWFGEKVPDGWERVWLKDMLTNFEVTPDMWYKEQFIIYKQEEYILESIKKWNNE